jgi:hypothetical protein
VAAGDVVRLTSPFIPGRRFRVAELQPGRLIISRDGEDRTRQIAYPPREEFWVSRGRYSRGTGAAHAMRTAALYGLIAGTLYGIGSYDYATPVADREVDPSVYVLVLGSGTAIGAGMLGIVVGAIHPAIHWERVTPAMLPSIGAHGGAPVIGLTIRF